MEILNTINSLMIQGAVYGLCIAEVWFIREIYRNLIKPAIYRRWTKELKNNSK